MARAVIEALGALQDMQKLPLPLAISCASLVIGACGSGYPPPAGYEEACYGSDFGANLVGKSPKFMLHLEAEERNWPDIAATLKKVGAAHGLKIFDTSRNVKALRSISISLCTSQGLFIYVDERIWEKPMLDMDPGYVSIWVTPYRENYNWTPIAKALTDAFGTWNGIVESKYLDTLAAAPNNPLDRSRP